MPEKPPDLRRLIELLNSGAGVLTSLSKFAGLFAPPATEESADPYRVLGVQREDSPELVKAVYRVRCKILHPDNQVTGNVEAYKRVQVAYSAILKERSVP